MDALQERLRILRETLVERWASLTQRQKHALMGGTVAFIVGLMAIAVFLILRSGSPSSYGTLFTGLESEDASAIVALLKDEKVDYRLAENGTAILVPRGKVLEKRLEMAGQGLPSKGTVGYELFDNTKLGATDFQQKINLRRAIEGELSRTIMGIDSVENARVMIVQAEPSLFIDKDEDSTAAVAIKIKKGHSLEPEQVRGIIHLVAASIKGLEPKNVTVVDDKGDILSDLDDKNKIDEKLRLSDLQLKHKKQLEDMYEQKIYKALAKVLGDENVVVVVTAELDYDVHTTEDEVYEPVVGDSGITRSEQIIEEKYLGTGTVPEIGVPGTTSNIPGYKGLAEGNAEYNRSEETRNYEITKRLDKKQKNQGDIRRISVAVMINEDISYEEADGEPVTYITRRRIRDIQNNVIAAANLDAEKRGDKVSVIGIKFTKNPDSMKALWAAQEKWKRIWKLIYAILAILAILVVFLLSWMMLKASVVKEELPEEDEFDEDALEEPVPVEDVMIPELTAEQRTRERIKEEVLRMINDDPEGAALIIRSWLFDDKE